MTYEEALEQRKIWFIEAESIIAKTFVSLGMTPETRQVRRIAKRIWRKTHRVHEDTCRPRYTVIDAQSRDVYLKTDKLTEAMRCALFHSVPAGPTIVCGKGVYGICEDVPERGTHVFTWAR